MESSNIDDLEAFTKNPGNRRYWIKSRRDVIYKIFKQEILDEKLSVPGDKVTKAIAELGEELNSAMKARIRAFIYRARKDRLRFSTAGKPRPKTRISPRRTYWTPDRQEIVRKVFRSEILDTSLLISEDKLNKALDELGEGQNRLMRAKVKKFITRIRSDRKGKQKKDSTVSPLPSGSENTNEDAKTDRVTPSSDKNQMDVENEDESESKNEANTDPVVPSLFKNNAELTNNNESEDTPKTRKKDAKCDSGVGSLNRSMGFENDNQVPFSSTKKTTNWTPAMVSVMKNHFTQELSASYLPSETDKVDYVTDFLKSKGFDDITRETIFTWADAQFEEKFDHNPDDLLNKVSDCLVSGVIHGDIDLKFIVDSYLEASDLAEISFDELNHMEEIPVDYSTSTLRDRGDSAEAGDLRLLTDVRSMKEKVVNEPMSSENETINE